MSFIPVKRYIIGIVVMGFAGWLLNGIKEAFTTPGIHETGSVWTLLDYIWIGGFIVYLIFGGIWLVRKYNEDQYHTRRRF